LNPLEIPFTVEDLGRRRTPAQLREFVESIRARVRSNLVELKKGICKTGIYKEFLDEVLPLSYFAEVEYPSNFTIQPIMGNQGFDAVVYNEAGVLHERLELSVPHDGASAAASARARAEVGHGIAFIGEPCEDFSRITPYVLETCLAKAQKDYSDIRLVVVINVQQPFEGHEEKYQACVTNLLAKVAAIRFKAKGVVLFFPPRYIATVW